VSAVSILKDFGGSNPSFSATQSSPSVILRAFSGNLRILNPICISRGTGEKDRLRDKLHQAEMARENQCARLTLESKGSLKDAGEEK
jgi:hypothetical protein